ncbi:MAG: ChbG/HpnK family deacetylase [Erysipelotrichaceae bacterium]|nr:ChbG/HpnK family deacetylase [Erysipelotrichaceae bacterium]
MIELVIRADDIGYSEAVNYGIEKSIRYGLIRSAGVMPNMPYAEHGVRLVENLNVCLGQHTNICLGKPCCDPKDIPSLVDENGEFLASSAYRNAYAQGKDLVDIEDAVREAEAQYFRFKEITGKEPAYFEAHAISSENLWKALKNVAEKYSLPFNYMTPDTKIGSFCDKPVAACIMESMKPDYEPFETLKKAVKNAREDMPNIFVCHPGYVDDYLLKHSSLTLNRTKEVAMLCDPEVREYLNKHDVKLLSYEEIR